MPNRDPHPEEALWVEAAKRGDEQAFGKLVCAYQVRVTSLLSRMVRDPGSVRELSQQTWIRVWKSLPRYKGDAKFFTWLYRIATRIALDHLRRNKRRDEVEYEDGLVHETRGLHGRSPDRALVHEETMARFRQGLETLGAKHRTALVLREIEGLSYEEIAQVMGCRIGTVMSRLHTARNLLRTWMNSVS